MQMLVTTARLLLTAYYVLNLLLMPSLQSVWKDAQQTLQIMLPNCYAVMQLSRFWGTDPAPSVSAEGSLCCSSLHNAYMLNVN